MSPAAISFFVAAAYFAAVAIVEPRQLYKRRGAFVAGIALVCAVVALCWPSPAVDQDILVDEPDAVRELARKADYPICVTVKPGPITPDRPVNPFGRKKDDA